MTLPIVAAVQLLLNALRAGRQVPVTGHFDAQTDAAVRELQRREGSGVSGQRTDGYVGPHTWSRLTAEHRLAVRDIVDIFDLGALPDGRQFIARAQEIGREADLWSFAHVHRYSTRPSAWSGEQRRATWDFLETFTRPDGRPQPAKTTAVCGLFRDRASADR